MVTEDSIDVPHDALVERAGEVLTTTLASRELVMLDVEQGLYFGVEDVARYVWETLAVPRTVAEVVDGVRAAFPDADPQAADREVRAFLADLLRHRLVRVVPEAERA